MLEISNSLRQRLGARPQPQTHPDPDVLNAYVEQALPAAERADVILHLSECSYCREVISLSLPPVQLEKAQSEVQPQSVFASSRFWIPAFRLGAAVAVLAVATTLVIKKPWQTGPVGQPQPSQTSQTLQAPPPGISTVAPPATSSVNRESSQPVETRAAGASAAPWAANAQETRMANARAPERVAAAAPQPLSVAGGIPQGAASGVAGGLVQGAASNNSNQSQQAEVTEVAAANNNVDVQAAQPAEAMVADAEPVATEAQYRNTSRDYLNMNALKSDPGTQNGDLASSGSTLMANAPTSQSAASQSPAQNGKAFPAISMERAVNHAFDVNVAPPTTSPSASGGASDTTIKHSKFFVRVPKTVGSTVEKGAVAAFDKAATVGQQFGHTSFAGNMLAKQNLTQPDNQSTTTETSAPSTQWRIDGGTLMKSTDSTQWREAYPQGHNLQLKVLVTRGNQIWAGGDNATMIHSWDAGVDWETLKIPNAGDITSINVDDGWQVKTSDGKTFVSNDHGKTWVPIEPGK